uniref:Uncharacterized protein n=1 Tax=Oryza meridionalis TaxID=40149 RepID=A0A0E0F3U2_9ORYZ
MESGLNPREKHRGLGEDFQEEWDPKCTTRLSPRGGQAPPNSKVRLRFQEGRFVQFGFYLRYARFKRIEQQGFLFAAQFQICQVSPKSSCTPMAGRYYTPPTPRPPPENTLDVFMVGDAIVIRTTITSSHYLAAQFVNKIAREHHEGGGSYGLNPRGKHCGLGRDSQVEWAPKYTIRLSPRGRPNTSNCRLLRIPKSDYDSNKAGPSFLSAIPNLSSKSKIVLYANGRQTSPTPRPPRENTLGVFMDGDAMAIRTTITLSHYLAAKFINKIAREHHEGGGMESGLNPRGKHRGLGRDSQAEWAPKCTTRLSLRGGPNTSNCRLLRIPKSDYDSKKASLSSSVSTCGLPALNGLSKAFFCQRNSKFVK